MSAFSIIPVLDLQGGTVVHARAGKRSDYRPIATPLGRSDHPVAIARALLAITGASELYIADLDAIAGTGNQFEICRTLADALPNTTVWVDAGFANVRECAFWLPLGATLVIGSENLPAIDNWNELSEFFGESLVLSLDFGPEGFRGPEALLGNSDLWPSRVIAMQLARVGTSEGPDVKALTEIGRQAGERNVFAAGGVRGIPDLEIAADSGAAGALVATALHSGAITENDIAAFLQRRSNH